MCIFCFLLLHSQVKNNRIVAFYINWWPKASKLNYDHHHHAKYFCTRFFLSVAGYKFPSHIVLCIHPFECNLLRFSRKLFPASESLNNDTCPRLLACCDKLPLSNVCANFIFRETFSSSAVKCTGRGYKHKSTRKRTSCKKG